MRLACCCSLDLLYLCDCMYSLGPMPSIRLKGSLNLPVSKSIANRLLILQALQGQALYPYDAAWSNDVKCLHQHLSHQSTEYDFKDAGTPLRLFLAYSAFKGNDGVILGSKRLSERPIKALLKSLEILGAEFEFLEQAYQLPLRVKKAVNRQATTTQIEVHESSQFLSALLLIAPYFEHGLVINCIGQAVSSTYTKLTQQCLKSVAKVEQIKPEQIQVSSRNLFADDLPKTIEADWSSAAFVLAWAALSDQADIILPNLTLSSAQGDAVVAQYMKAWGVHCADSPVGLKVFKNQGAAIESTLLHFDLTSTPDLFPVMLALCAVSQRQVVFSGLAHQIHKESNRLQAMLSNLAPYGLSYELSADAQTLKVTHGVNPNPLFQVKAFSDHRIIMACSLLAFVGQVQLDAIEDVSKSFPDFFDKIKTLY